MANNPAYTVSSGTKQVTQPSYTAMGTESKPKSKPKKKGAKKK